MSTVDIPNDEMKGRIIGREGRNIRAFEKATGVDVIVDDTPGVVIVTGFDSVRREIAKIALERLIQDGRIHPTRIEEIVKETQEDIEQHIRRLGQQAALEANVVGLHEKLLDYLGRLHFRTSYSQNVLRHSLEVAYLTGLLAEEVGLNGPVGRRCGLLHDIGKAADHEMDGGHPAVGAELARRYGESKEVIHAALGTMMISGSRRPIRCSFPPLTRSVPAAPVPGAKPWKNTCGGWRSSNRSSWASRALSRLTPSRRDARSACWSTASSSTTPSPPSCAARSPSRSKPGCLIPGRSR